MFIGGPLDGRWAKFRSIVRTIDFPLSKPWSCRHQVDYPAVAITGQQGRGKIMRMQLPPFMLTSGQRSHRHLNSRDFELGHYRVTIVGTGDDGAGVEG
jgi:hypothetical protein